MEHLRIRWYLWQRVKWMKRYKKGKISIFLQMVSNLDADLYMFVLNQDTATLELIGGSAITGLGTQEFIIL